MSDYRDLPKTMEVKVPNPDDLLNLTLEIKPDDGRNYNLFQGFIRMGDLLSRLNLNLPVI